MVAQDGQPQRRRSMTAAAIRRGHVKISGPIPWEDTSGVSPAQAPAPAPAPAPVPVPVPVPAPASQHRPQGSAGSATSQAESAPRQHSSASHGSQGQIKDGLPEEESEQQQADPLASAAPPLRHKRASLPMREESEVQQPIQQRLTTPVDRVLGRESMAVATDSPGSLASGSLQRQRTNKRRSGIRFFKRLFSRREKAGTKETSPHRATLSRQHGYATSDLLPAANTAPETSAGEQAAQPRRNTSPQAPREPLLPSEVEAPSRTLQRLPFPMNINAPADATHSLEATTSEGPRQGHRRRATLPSVVVSPSDQAALQAYWGKAESHVASPTDPSSRGSLSPLIGMAITSGVNPRRRSRSAGALYDLARLDDQVEQRRRSAEIQYWRQSFMDNVGPSQTRSMAQEPSQAGSVYSQHGSAADRSVSEARINTASTVPEEQIRAFDFGDLGITEADTAASIHLPKEDDSMTSQGEDQQQPHVAVNRADPVDQRLSQLEINMLNLTSSLRELTGRAHRQTVLLGTNKRARSYSPTPPADVGPEFHTPTIHRQAFDVTSEPGKTPVMRISPKRIQPSPPPSASTVFTGKPSMRQVADSYLSSPSSVGGVSPYHHVPTESLPIHFPASTPSSQHRISRSASAAQMYLAPPDPTEQDQTLYTHLAPLYSALRYERLQRKGLEGKMHHMAQQISELTALVSHMRSRIYPTPSPDQLMTSRETNSTHTSDPHRQTGVSRFSASAYGDSEDASTHPEEGYDERREEERQRRDPHRLLQGHELGPVAIQEDELDDRDEEFSSPLESWSTPREEKTGWVHAGNMRELVGPRSVEGEMF